MMNYTWSPTPEVRIGSIERITATARIVLGDDGIVFLRAFPHTTQSREEALENLAAIREIQQGKRYPLLVDVRQNKPLAAEARTCYTSPESHALSTALGLLIDSLTTRLIGNLIMSFNRSLLPTRIFTTEDDAFAWLMRFRS